MRDQLKQAQVVSDAAAPQEGHLTRVDDLLHRLLEAVVEDGCEEAVVHIEQGDGAVVGREDGGSFLVEWEDEAVVEA